ncbi:50S ribosomal protein L13 [Candidatus Pacearchaeota archaeon]|nr:50S ribosomal protein L13 [Candidatus Pacearchaeota archaeon]
MVQVIDGEGAVAGRIASYSAKEALKGEEIAILNCEKAIISGTKKAIKEKFHIQRGRVGTLQVGPKISSSPEKILKKMIRGMVPNYRTGRGREAFERIKCYEGIPEKFKGAKMMEIFKERKIKEMKIGELSKKWKE